MSKRQSDEARLLGIFAAHDPLWKSCMLEVLKREVKRDQEQLEGQVAAVKAGKPAVKRRRGPNKPKSSTPPVVKPDGADTASGQE